MTRISRNTRRAVLAVPSDISAALDELGIDHLVRGGEALGLCPSPDHDDHRPSWSCNLKTGQHHCFSCGYGGSFTRLVSTVRGVKFGEADLWVRTHRVGRPLSVDEIAHVQERRKTEVRESDLWACTGPPDYALAERGISREAAAQLELLWDDKGWVFPIRDPDKGRLIGWQLKRGKTVRNRPIDVEKSRALFGAKQVRALGTEGDIIVVESPLNAARFLTAGFPRVVATYGIEFSDTQITEVQKLGTGILFAQDNDKAGQRKIAQWLHEHPLERQFCTVFDYGSVFEDDLTHAFIHPKGDGRDACDLLNWEIARGVQYATSARRSRFEEFPQWP